jgi:hypothetical protein
MFARVSPFDVRSERIQEGSREIVEHVVPALEMQNGYSGALLLVNSQQGKLLAVSLWESEQDMHATDEASRWFRLFGAEAPRGWSQTLRLTRSTSHDWIIHNLDSIWDEGSGWFGPARSGTPTPCQRRAPGA